MNRPKVYLAGPISGLTYDQGQSWRDVAVREFEIRGIEGFSPLRAKDYLRSEGVLEQSYQINCLSTDRGITTRDRWDVDTADVVLFNLLGATRVSIGTCIEFGWADAHRKPIVTIIEDGGNLHDSPIVRGVTGFRVSSLAAGIDVVSTILKSR